jgi:hypothetical protein
VDISNPGGNLTSQLLPAGKPSAGLICRYNSSIGDGHPSALAHATVLSTTAAQTLARSANAIWTGSAGSSSMSCPSDTGLYDVIVFSYPSQPDVDLWYHTSGCQGVDNGYISGGEDGNPSFYNGFQPLVASLT